MSAAELAEAANAIRAFLTCPCGRCAQGARGPTDTARGPIPARRCAQHAAGRARSTGSSARHSAPAIPTSWRSAISPAPCRSIRGCFCATARLTHAVIAAGAMFMPSPSARGSPTSPARSGRTTRTLRSLPWGGRRSDWEGGTRIGAALRAVQQGLVAARSEFGRGRDPDHRRAGARRPRPPRPRGREAFPERGPRSSGSIRSCGSRDSRRARAACGRSCPMWTAFTPAIRSTAFRRYRTRSDSAI
jgi:hypothetical protein